MATIEVKVSVAQMKEFLAEGLTRKEIAQRLEVPQKVVSQIFQPPELKAKKAAKIYNVDFVEDGTVSEQTEEANLPQTPVVDAVTNDSENALQEEPWEEPQQEEPAIADSEEEPWN